ncbi:MAG: hypothetical protein LBU88_02850 [Treponema sp.]|nr:hypothetical protein [Treponema sp.]
MKNTVKFIGIIALVAMIGFAMAGCSGGAIKSQSTYYGTWTQDDSNERWQIDSESLTFRDRGSFAGFTAHFTVKFTPVEWTAVKQNEAISESRRNTEVYNNDGYKITGTVTESDMEYTYTVGEPYSLFIFFSKTEPSVARFSVGSDGSPKIFTKQ